MCILDERRNIFTTRLANSFIDRRQRWDRTGTYSLHNTHLQAWRQRAWLCPKATTSDCQHLSYILFNCSLKYSKHGKKSLGKSRLSRLAVSPAVLGLHAKLICFTAAILMAHRSSDSSCKVKIYVLIYKATYFCLNVLKNAQIITNSRMEHISVRRWP